MRTEDLLAFIIAYRKKCRSICIKPEKAAARIVEGQIDIDADSRIILKRMRNAVILIDLAGIFFAVLICRTVRIITGRGDDDIDLLFFFEFFRRPLS